MKRIVLLTVFISMIIGCANKEDYSYKEATISIDNLVPTELVDVSVPTDSAVIIKLGSDTIAVCTESGSVLLPKVYNNTSNSKKTRASIEDNSNGITYETVKKNGTSLVPKIQLYSTVAFEDSKNGDYDYNDLIIHTRLWKDNNSIKINVQPIAMGAYKDFSLGVVLNGDESTSKILYESCRNDLFPGTTGFVNTLPDHEFIQYQSKPAITLTNVNNITSIDYFIVVDGEKFYAVSKNFNCTDNKNRPFGLILVNIRAYHFRTPLSNDCGYDWWKYPQEYVNIDSVYNYTETFSKDGTPDFSAFDFKKAKSTKYIECINDCYPDNDKTNPWANVWIDASGSITKKGDTTKGSMYAISFP